MQHPFEGLIQAEATAGAAQETHCVAQPQAHSSRRSFFRQTLAAGAGLLAALAGSRASAQSSNRRFGPVTTKAVGEEGTGNDTPGPVTTYALGEEAGRPTTYALGEEGGQPTTYALGEEAGRATTYALGEEGSGRRRPPRRRTQRPRHRRGQYTPMALGEEGGWH